MTLPPPAGPVPQSPPSGLCPSCRSADLSFVAELEGPVHTSKLLDDFETAAHYPRGQVALWLCAACGLITNTTFDAPGHDYTASYEETQAFSPRFRQYADELAATLVERHDLRGRDVLEIGCGKGDVLQRLCRATGGAGVGIDPSWLGETLDADVADRITVHRSFFDGGLIDRAYGLILCRHTLEHVHDVHAFLRDLRTALEPYPDTVVVFEIPETLRILRADAFWDVYYEHCSYFTPGSLARAFRAAEFRPTELELTFDDQYALVTVRAGEGGDTLPLEEPASEVATASASFAEGLERQRRFWTARLGALRDRGQTSAVWGAGSKGVGFLAALGLSDEVACAVDVNPTKHGMYLPGTGHEIVPPERLLDVRPDVVVVMNAAYLAEIQANLAELGIDADVEAL
jgi:SAM-dependent methyltransferase